MSAIPVSAPEASLQVSMMLTSPMNSDVDPIIAAALAHASRKPLVLSVALIFESHSITSIWRHARPPAALTALAHALVPSIEPWNRPGASSEPTSAITNTVMVSALIPVSVPSRVAPAHGSAAASVVGGAVVSPPAVASLVTGSGAAVVGAAVAGGTVVSGVEATSSRPHAAKVTMVSAQRAPSNCFRDIASPNGQNRRVRPKRIRRSCCAANYRDIRNDECARSCAHRTNRSNASR